MIDERSIETLIAQNAELLAQNRQLIAMLQQGQTIAPPPVLPPARKLTKKEQTRETLTAWAYDYLKPKYPDTLFPIFLAQLEKRFK